LLENLPHRWFPNVPKQKLSFLLVAKHQEMDENVIACVAIAKALRATFGPAGMDKLIVVEGADEKRIIVSNDGATVLEHIRKEIKHPLGILLSNVAKSQVFCCGINPQ
jgi:chaperonin GroEL (HSP60 family)